MDHTSTSSQEIADGRNSDSSTDSGNKSSRRHTRELWWTRRPLKNFWPLSLLWLDDLDDDARRQLLCHSGLRVGDDKLWQLAKRGGSQDGAQYEASEDTPWHIPRFLNPWQDMFLGFTNLTDGELRLCSEDALGDMDYHHRRYRVLRNNCHWYVHNMCLAIAKRDQTFDPESDASYWKKFRKLLQDVGDLDKTGLVSKLEGWWNGSLS